MKKIIFSGVITLAVVITVNAQFSLSGELRPRTEYSHGYGTLAADGQKASIFTSQRTRLNLDYKKDLLNFGLVFQDVRVWGSQAQLTDNQTVAVNLHQAWGEIGLTKEFGIKIGRQELSYDDQRILGSVGWAQQARSHDLALLKYTGKLNVHVGLAHHENTNRKNNFFDGLDAYKDLQFLWINRKTDKLNWSLLFLNNGKPVKINNKQVSKYSQTFGAHIDFPLKRLTLSGNLYFQSGEDGNNKSLSGHNLLIEANYKATEKIQLLAGYELLSGTDYDKTQKNRSFNPIYGTNHKFNGFMDYFYAGGQHLFNVGLSDLYAKFTAGNAKTIFNADIHFFSSAARVSATDKNYLGTELDLTLTYNLNQVTRFSLGYSKLFATESMKIIKGVTSDAPNNWAYLMIAITPKFIQ